MHKIYRAFQISDGLASLAGKKIKAAISELRKEKVLTPREASILAKNLERAKKAIYGKLSGEIKKIALQASKMAKKQKK